MTAREIKRQLRENKAAGRGPSSLRDIALDLGVSPSMITTALKTPRRYPKARRDIEAAVRASMASHEPASTTNPRPVDGAADGGSDPQARTKAG